LNGVPQTVTIEKSGANLAALEAITAGRETPNRIRESKYHNNLAGQDHRAIERRTRPVLGFKRFAAPGSFWRASKKAGVTIAVCGQALAEHHFQYDWINADVTLALSALTTIMTLEQQGYVLMPL
jgi:hypothetical protein